MGDSFDWEAALTDLSDEDESLVSEELEGLEHDDSFFESKLYDNTHNFSHLSSDNLDDDMQSDDSEGSGSTVGLNFRPERAKSLGIRASPKNKNFYKNHKASFDREKSELESTHEDPDSLDNIISPEVDALISPKTSYTLSNRLRMTDIGFRMSQITTEKNSDSIPLSRSRGVHKHAEEEQKDAFLDRTLGSQRKRKTGIRGRPRKEDDGLGSSTSLNLTPEAARIMGQANFSYVMRKYKEARSLFMEVIRLAPQAIEAYLTLGMICEEEAEIRDNNGKILGYESSMDPESCQNLSQNQILNPKMIAPGSEEDEAIEYYRLAVKLGGARLNPDLWLKLVRLCRLQFERQISHDPEDHLCIERRRKLLIQNLTRLNASSFADYDSFWTRSRLLVEADDMRAAISGFYRLLVAYIGDESANIFDRVYVLSKRLGLPLSAAEMFRKIVIDNRYNVSGGVFYYIIWVLLECMLYAELKEVLELVAPVLFESTSSVKSSSYYSLGVEERRNFAIRSLPINAQFIYSIACGSLASSDAIVHSVSLASTEQVDFGLCLRYAEVMSRQGQHARALEAGLVCMTDAAYFVRGALISHASHRHLGSPDSAIRILQTALQARPMSGDLMSALCTLHKELGMDSNKFEPNINDDKVEWESKKVDYNNLTAEEKRMSSSDIFDGLHSWSDEGIFFTQKLEDGAVRLPKRRQKKAILRNIEARLSVLGEYRSLLGAIENYREDPGLVFSLTRKLVRSVIHESDCPARIRDSDDRSVLDITQRQWLEVFRVYLIFSIDLTGLLYSLLCTLHICDSDMLVGDGHIERFLIPDLFQIPGTFSSKSLSGKSKKLFVNLSINENQPSNSTQTTQYDSATIIKFIEKNVDDTVLYGTLEDVETVSRRSILLGPKTMLILRLLTAEASLYGENPIKYCTWIARDRRLAQNAFSSAILVEAMRRSKPTDLVPTFIRSLDRHLETLYLSGTVASDEDISEKEDEQQLKINNKSSGLTSRELSTIICAYYMVLANMAAGRYEAVIRCSEPIMNVLNRHKMYVPAKIRISMAVALLSRSMSRTCLHTGAYQLRAICLLDGILESESLHLYNMGRAYHFLGFLDLAVTYYRRLVKKFSNNGGKVSSSIKTPEDRIVRNVVTHSSVDNSSEFLNPQTSLNTQSQNAENSSLILAKRGSKNSPVKEQNIEIENEILLRAATFNLHLILLEQGEILLANSLLVTNIVF